MASLNQASYNPDGGVDSFQTSEAMTAYKAVKLNSTYTYKIDLCDTAGEEPYGVVDQIWASGDNANVFRSGVVPMTAGAAIAAGARVAVDSAGKAITATELHDYSIGLAITASTATGDVISVLLDIKPMSAGILSTTGRKIQQAAIAFGDGATENSTAITFPAAAIVTDAWLVVSVAEATGATKTIDVGTTLVSNDPDGFLDGISVAATGIVKATATYTTGGSEVYFASSTYGDLLAPTQVAGSDAVEDTGTYYEEKRDTTSSADVVSWTPGSADFAELVAVLYIEYIELAS